MRHRRTCQCRLHLDALFTSVMACWSAANTTTLIEGMKMDVNFQRTFQYEHSIHFCELIAASSGWNTEMDKGQSVHEGRERERGRVEEKWICPTLQIMQCMCVWSWLWCVCVCARTYAYMYMAMWTTFAQQPLCHSLFLLPCSDIGLCLSSHLLLSVFALFPLLPCCLGLLIQTKLQYRYTSIHITNVTRIHSTGQLVYTHTTYTTYTECSSR